MSRAKKIFSRVVLVLIGIVVAIQLVPYGRNHTNPPAAPEPSWDSPRTRELFHRACANCHSHDTVWPWYSHVAPASWLVQHDVEEARRHFNVSDENKRDRRGGRAADALADGEMPPWYYLPAHPRARLSSAEKEALAAGLQATFGGRPLNAGGGAGENGDHD